jgi:hypothetical protein
MAGFGSRRDDFSREYATADQARWPGTRGAQLPCQKKLRGTTEPKSKTT